MTENNFGNPPLPEPRQNGDAQTPPVPQPGPPPAPGAYDMGGVPQPPAPGYQNQNQPQYPAAPGYPVAQGDFQGAYPAEYAAYGVQQAAPPNAFALTWGALWFSQWKPWVGKPTEVTDRSDKIVETTGNKWMTWLLTYILNSLVWAIAITALLGRSFVFNVDPFGLGGNSFGHSPSGGTLVIVFFWVLLFAFVAYILRALGLWWSLRVGGKDISFHSVNRLYASTKMLVWFPTVILAFFALTGIFQVLEIATVWTMGIGLGVAILTQISLFLVSLREVRTAESSLSTFKWYMIFFAGSTLSYCAITLAFSLLSLVFGALM
jgi:hypothetical protein